MNSQFWKKMDTPGQLLSKSKPQVQESCGYTFTNSVLRQNFSALFSSLYDYLIYFLQYQNTWIINGSNNFSTVNVWICRSRGSIFSLMLGSLADISPRFKKTNQLALVSHNHRSHCPLSESRHCLREYRPDAITSLRFWGIKQMFST